MQIEAPDGSLVDFPDGTPDVEIERAMREAFGGPEPVAAEPSMVDTILRGASSAIDQTGRGVAQGIVGMLALPNTAARLTRAGVKYGMEKTGFATPQSLANVDAFTSPLADYYPSYEQMMAAGDTGNDAWADKFGVERPDRTPDNMLERGLNRVGQEFGGMMLPAAGVLSHADKASDAFGGLLKKAAIDPNRFLASEAKMAAGVGIGGAAANEIVDPNTTSGKVADLLGSLLGGGMTVAGGAAGSQIGDVLSAIFGSGKFASNVTRESVVNTVLQNSDVAAKQMGTDAPIDTSELVGLIQQPSRAEEVIPGFRPSTADRAADFSLASLEDARARGHASGLFRNRQEANTGAIENALASSVPTERPSAFSGALSAERDRRIAAAAAAEETARGAHGVAVQGAQPTMRDATARGSTLRAGLQDARDVVDRDVHDRFGIVNHSNIPAPAGALDQRFRNVGDGLTTNEQRLVPPEAAIPGRLVQRDEAGNIIEEASNVPFREFASARSTLAEGRRADLNAGQNNAARIKKQYVDEIDAFTEDVLPPEMRQRYDEARAARRDMADRFERPGTAIESVLRRREGGDYQLDHSAVPPRFTPTDQGKLTDLQMLMREAGQDPRVRGAVTDEILSDVGQRGLRDRPADLGGYLSERSNLLGQFPEARDRLGRVQQTGAAAETAGRAATETRTNLTTPGKSATASYLLYGDEQARRAMNSVIEGRRPADDMDELLNTAGNAPEAVQGARRAFWDVMEDKGRAKNGALETADRTDPWMPKKWRTWLEKPNVKAAAQRLYRDNPEHLENIETIADALRGVNTRSKASAVVNPSGTAQSARGQALTMAEAQAKFADVARGRMSKAYFVTYMAGRLARRMVSKQAETAFGQLLDKALLEPDVAAALLKEYNPANRAALARGAKLWLGNRAVALGELLDEDDDETVGAVMRGAPANQNIDIPGLIEQGNLDLNNRKVLNNADGSISTEQSASFNIDGVEVLLPTVIGGKKVSDEEAIRHYNQTGENLGKFRTPAEADAFAESLHKRQEKRYGR